MSEDEKKTRKFQYALTKAQIDLEYWLALGIGILAIAYGLLSFYKDNFLGRVLTNVLILVAIVFVTRIYYIKEEKFKAIKKLYLDD